MKLPVPGLLLALLLPGCSSAPERTPSREAATPGPRWGHVLIWDPLREAVLLFGGARERGSYLADTWTWNGESWRRHAVEGPPARGFAAVAFHAARGTVVLHGGRAEGRRPHADTWEWDGSSWRQIEAAGALAADHHGMVYLPASRELLAFGGWNGEGVSAETWLFGGEWRLSAADGPPPRSAFGMAWDFERAVAVVCGGLWIEGQYADVWEWVGGEWRAASGPYDNSSLDHHSLLWDPERPEPRHSSPLAWDGHGRRVLLYGGKKYDGDEQVPLGDLWAWDGAIWERLAG